MHRFRAAHAAFAALILAFSGCNLFKETVGSGPDGADEHILEGQLLLRKAKYDQALAQFDAALAKDSSKSEAYYGAAKCRLLQQRINMFKLLESFQNNDGKSIPFLSEPDSIKDKIYVANRGINIYLGRLADRDARGLSDGIISAHRFSADYALASAIEAVLSIADFNGDGRINAKDNILSGIIDFTDPSKLNPDSIMANIADLKNDTAKIAALNNLLDKSSDLLAKSDKAIDLFLTGILDKKDSISGGSCAPADTNCQKVKAALPGSTDQVGDSAIGQVKKFIQDAGSTVVLYKVFDKSDNDGDGCVDEELLDGIDNDGDGRVDEDSRGAPDTAGNVFYRAEKDLADNDGDGKLDALDPDEGLFTSRYEGTFAPMALLLHPDRKGQIFWADSSGGAADSRRKVLVPDSSVSPPALDTVPTFDLCHGPVNGFKKGK
jgi:tetratricopeptide (TPR) repeat protein